MTKSDTVYIAVVAVVLNIGRDIM